MKDQCHQGMLKNEHLMGENERLQRALEDYQGCSESRLRSAMTRSGVTTCELAEAVSAVEALLGEAKRELQARQFRERRAAFELLHDTVAKWDEGALVKAIAEARRTKVDAEDIEKVETRLHDLRSLTDEQRAARAKHEVEVEAKRVAFMLVKRNNALELKEHLAAQEAAGMKSSW